MKKVIIGRAGQQPFAIKADGVSAEHCEITVTDDGKWILKDLKGDAGNGTFVRNDNGDYERIYNKEIAEHTMIRLSTGGHHSHTFMAHRAFDSSLSYNYEFFYFRKLYNELKEQEEAREKLNKRHALMSRWTPMLGLMISLCLTNIWLIRLFMTLIPFLVSLFFQKDPDKLKQIRLRRARLVVCPNCGRPLSEFDINNLQCSACKAH